MAKKTDKIKPELRELPLDILKARLDKLSVRSRNVVRTYLKDDEDNTLKWLKLFEENFPFTSIRNCGTRSATELRQFFNELEEEVLLLQAFDQEDRIWFSFVVKACRQYGLPTPFKKVYQPLGLMDALLTKSRTFSAAERLAIQEVLAVYTEQPKKLTDLTNEFSISRERVRQLRFIALSKIQNILEWLRLHQPMLISFPDHDKAIISLDASASAALNREHGVNFSRHFLTLYIAQVDRQRVLLGNQEDVFFATIMTHRTAHNWRSLYAVSDTLPHDKLNETVETLDKHVRKLRKKLRTWHIGKFMPKDMADKAANPVWHKALKTLLKGEFDLDLQQDGTFVLEPNGKRHLVDYFYDLLAEKKSRMSAAEIAELMEKRYPEVKFKLKSIMALTIADERIVHYGKGVYGLAEWNDAGPKLREGSIKKFALEYLEKKKKPVTYDELSGYVLQFRPNSNKWSIVVNLKSDKTYDFQVGGGEIALKRWQK